jgi:hypothetical protein
MPYFINTPAGRRILDDEDANFLHYFSVWGWAYEYHPANDPELLAAVKKERKGTRATSLYILWEEELRRRIVAEEAKRVVLRQTARDAEEQARKLEAGKLGENGKKKGLKSKISKLFKKTSDKEEEGYKDGVYVNHLEALQKKWFEDRGLSGQHDDV